MDSLFGIKKLEGKRVEFIKGKRTGIVAKHKSQGRLSIIWDDNPDVIDDGYLDEEFRLCSN